MESRQKALSFLFAGPYWAINKKLVRLIGLRETLWLTDLCSKWEYFEEREQLDEEGYFYNTQFDIEKDTGIAPRTQSRIMNKLIELNILIVKRAGLPARNYYKINFNKIIGILRECSDKITEQDLSKCQDKISQNQSTSHDKINDYNNNKDSNNKINKNKRLSSKDDNTLSASSRRRRRPVKDDNNSYSAERDIIRYWNSMGKPLAVHKNEESKTFNKALIEINKHLVDYNSDEIKFAIKQYHNTLVSPYTILSKNIPGHVISLHEFFRFTSYTKNRMQKAKVKLSIKSWFDECLPEKDPVTKYSQRARLVPDRYPYMSNKFKSLYVKKVLGDIPPSSFSNYDENCFRKASIRTFDFFKQNKKKLQIQKREIEKPVYLVRYIFNALDDSLDGNLSKVTPGWLCNDIMFNKTLPAYLQEQAMVLTDNF